MTPNNLWMDRRPFPAVEVIHRFRAGAGHAVPSHEPMQVPEAKSEIRLYRNRAASY